MNRAGTLIIRAAFVIAIFLLTAILPSARPASALTLDRVVAVVNNEVITWSELYRFMEFELSTRMRSLSDAEKRELFESREEHYISTLVEKEVQLQEARKKRLFANEAEVDEAVRSVMKKFSIDDEDFEKALMDEGFTLKEYRSRLAEQIVLGKLVTSEVTNKIVVDGTDVERYIKENQLRFEDLAVYKLLQIFFKKPEPPAQREAVEARAREVLGRLDAGEDFSALASAFSQDALAKTGGDLGYVKRTDLASEFTGALDAMAPGGVSKPFWTGAGLHIIKLIERTGPRSPQELALSVKKILREEQFSNRYGNWLRELKDNSYVEIKP